MNRSDKLLTRYIYLLGLFAVLSLVIVLVFCERRSSQAPAQQIPKPAATPRPVTKPTPRIHTPVIGMSYQAFESVCDERGYSLKDRTQSYESNFGYVAVLYRHHTSTRNESMCFGTFTFHNEHLYSIHR